MRQKVALALQFLVGLFGLYGIGRLTMGHWARGFLELVLVTPLVIMVWPMLYVPIIGHNTLLQVGPQIIVDVVLTWSLWRDLKRVGQIREEKGEQPGRKGEGAQG